MKKFMVVAMMIAAASLVATNASAQAGNPDSNWVKVTANVVGLFDFQIDADDWNTKDTDAATHGFGNVSFDGSTNDGGATFAATDGSIGTYTQAAAFGWTVLSAPQRSVDITFQNAEVDLASTGSLTLADLEMQMTITQEAGPAGTPTGWQALSGLGGTLINDVVAGNGMNEAQGNIDLRLTVTDTDTEGNTIYHVELVATGI